MQSDSEPAGQPVASFIRSSRRRQILGQATETLARVGYGNATLARIADDLGVSKGVISYHFDSKDALMIGVVEHGYQTLAEVIVPQLLAADTATEGLRTHVRAAAAYALVSCQADSLPKSLR